MIKNKIFAILILAFASVSLQAQPDPSYWQQAIKYDIAVDFDHNKNQFEGNQKMTYFNNSPDNLDRVFMHLYFNAFQPGSMMDVRSRTISDPDRRVMSRIADLSKDEIGYHKIKSLKQNGKAIKFKVEGTILVADLNETIASGGSSIFEIEYSTQVPVQIRRSGRDNKEGISYSMTQWYPKMCEYDQHGWHSNPYIGREFHGVWGDFNVQIKLDKKFVIGGTGYLDNPKEIGHGYAKGKGKPDANGKLTWKFSAPNVHDFAWAADPDFVHDQYKVDKDLTMHFFYQGDTLVDQWKKLQEFASDAFKYANKRFGRYPYKQYSFIQGGDGGMEYPMATLISGHLSQAGLNSVSVHESMHSWYQGVLATNESKFSWMDEGFTQFAQYEILGSLYEWSNPNRHTRAYAGYKSLALSGKEEPLTTHADHYDRNGVYSTNSYYKGVVFIHQLSYIIGQAALDKTMLNYFEAWKFKHPNADAFKRVAERTSGLELDWYFENFVGTTKQIDYAIRDVISREGKTVVIIDRIGNFPMPLDVAVVPKEGAAKMYNIPLEIMRGEKKSDGGFGENFTVLKDWPWVYPTYEMIIDLPLNQISKVVIDPSGRLADVDSKNDVYPSAKDIRIRSKD